MKKLVVLLMVSLLAANVAAAVVDPDDNMMGIYFDMNADAVDLASGAGMFSAYIVLTNPTYDQIYGYEFSWEMVTSGSYMAFVPTLYGPSPMDVGDGDNNYIVGLGGPMGTSEATVLVALSLYGAVPAPADLYLRGSVPASFDPELPTILLAASQMMTTGLSTGIGNPSATIMGGLDGIPVASEEASWDQVKSLYR